MAYIINATSLAFLAIPIARFANLRSVCGVSFMTVFLSATSANAMLADYYNKKLFGKTMLFIANLKNSFSAILMHWSYSLPYSRQRSLEIL